MHSSSRELTGSEKRGFNGYALEQPAAVIMVFIQSATDAKFIYEGTFLRQVKKEKKRGVLPRDRKFANRDVQDVQYKLGRIFHQAATVARRCVEN